MSDTIQIKGYWINKINREYLNRFKKNLEDYKFHIEDENGRSVDPDYVEYTFKLRSQSDEIRRYTENMHIYESLENTLLYSKEDIPLILEYMDYLKQLILIGNIIVRNVTTQKLKLSKSMTKKKTVISVLEHQNYILDCYDSLLDEILCISEIKEWSEYIDSHKLKV